MRANALTNDKYKPTKITPWNEKKEQDLPFVVQGDCSSRRRSQSLSRDVSQEIAPISCATFVPGDKKRRKLH